MVNRGERVRKLGGRIAPPVTVPPPDLEFLEACHAERERIDRADREGEAHGGDGRPADLRSWGGRTVPAEHEEPEPVVWEEHADLLRMLGLEVDDMDETIEPEIGDDDEGPA